MAGLRRRTLEVVQTADRTTAHAADRTTEMPQADAIALGRYRLVRRLGHGAFGVVWLAHDEQLDRMVAVKRIELHDGQVAARAEREAIAAARLSHPAIVTLFEAGRDEHAVHLVSELVRGPTLADLIEAGALSDRDVLRIGIALASALEHAHARGIVHRDVKPANVIVPERPEGESALAKLTDFGVAVIAGDGAITRTGDVVGTLAYMAPEQAEGKAVDGAADLYSLALVLYEALGGTNPIRAQGAAATARRVGMRLPPLARLRPDLAHGLCDALDCALLSAPEDRGTLAELRAELEYARDDAARDVGHVAPAENFEHEFGDRRGLSAADYGGRRAPVVPAGAPLRGDQWAPRRRRVHPSENDESTVGSRAAASLRARLLAGTAAGLLCAAALTLLPPSPAVPSAVALVAAAVVVLLPRAGWIALACALAFAFAASGFGGIALLIAAAALPTVLLLPLSGTLWSAPAGSPLVAAAGLSLAWPALAAQAGTLRARGLIAGLGLWWCLLAEQLLGRTLLLGTLPGAPRSSEWQASAELAAREILWPLLSSGALLLAVPWALAAVLLPAIVRGRSLVLDIVCVSGWAAGLAATNGAIAAVLAWPGGPPEARGVFAGALLGALVALLAAAARAPLGEGDLP
jgi:hypothetical protein